MPFRNIRMTRTFGFLHVGMHLWKVFIGVVVGIDQLVR